MWTFQIYMHFNEFTIVHDIQYLLVYSKGIIPITSFKKENKIGK